MFWPPLVGPDERLALPSRVPRRGCIGATKLTRVTRTGQPQVTETYITPLNILPGAVRNRNSSQPGMESRIS